MPTLVHGECSYVFVSSCGYGRGVDVFATYLVSFTLFQVK